MVVQGKLSRSYERQDARTNVRLSFSTETAISSTSSREVETQVSAGDPSTFRTA